MITDLQKSKARKDLIIAILASLIPAIIYLFFESTWRTLNQNDSSNFWLVFIVQSLLSYSLAGLGFTIIMIYRKENFKYYGLIKKNSISTIILSIIVFVPHFIFLISTKGFNGYAPMSGSILYNSVIERPFIEKIFCFIIVFLIWGFCEGFTYVFLSQKLNIIFSNKNKLLNIGAIIGGILCVLMHGGISLDFIKLLDAITMFIFVYGILTIKDIKGNALGCIFSFLLLWNAFP